MRAIKVHCQFDKMVAIEKLKHHPKNHNTHPKAQIKRLAKILDYQGWRYPIKVSKQSGFITSGHGRVMAAKLLKQKIVPVNYQDYESNDMEVSDVTSDNAIAAWSDLDIGGVENSLKDFKPDFNTDLLGIKNFDLDNINNSNKKQPDDVLEYIISVSCKDEREQEKIFKELEKRGLQCKLIT